MKKLRPGEVICPEPQVMPETEAEAQYSSYLGHWHEDLLPKSYFSESGI